MNCPFSEAPEIPVKIAILNALDEVLHGNTFRVVKVGDGTAHLEDSIMGPGRKVHAVHGIHELLGTFPVEQAIRFDLTGTHLGIGINFW